MARTGSSLPRGIDWIPVDVALANLRATMPVLDETERVVVDDATERVPANDLLAARDNPPGSNAAVDGYGFVHQGGGGRRNLVRGSSVPGAPYAGVIGDGQAVRILTGARIPPGVDTVVMEENTRVAHGVLTMTDCPDPGANIRIAGEDFRYGDTVFGKGKRLGINDLATLAATGMQEIDVIRRPRIGVLSTGDELIEARFDTDSYDTVDMNRPVLLAMIRQWGFEARDLGRIRDDAASLRQVLGSVAGNLDAVLTTGGASASEQDHVSALLKAEGSHHLWRIAMKPGRPLVMAHWQGMPILGLPGNPDAAIVCELIFAYPALC
ncbi:MAG: molybdopterin-binding protein, partial [Rhodobacteraceae bacterium]|nr:molybdopterin-binding protein [Paracoccaceae bacterium]